MSISLPGVSGSYPPYYSSGMTKTTKTSQGNSKTDKSKPGISDLINEFEETHKLTAKELKEKDDDWRKMTEEEWDKFLEGVDDYIEDVRARLKQMKELQDEAARKAAMEADSDMRSIAAASAALSVAAGGTAGVSFDGEESEDKKNWTKNLKTDDQVILRTAKAAQEMESMAVSKLQEIQLTGNTTSGIMQTEDITEFAGSKEFWEDFLTK